MTEFLKYEGKYQEVSIFKSIDPNGSEGHVTSQIIGNKYLFSVIRVLYISH